MTFLSMQKNNRNMNEQMWLQSCENTWGGYIFFSGRHGNWSLASFRFSIVAANHIIEKHMKCDF